MEEISQLEKKSLKRQAAVIAERRVTYDEAVADADTNNS
jgi:hypothetical protein